MPVANPFRSKASPTTYSHKISGINASSGRFDTYRKFIPQPAMQLFHPWLGIEYLHGVVRKEECHDVPRTEDFYDRCSGRTGRHGIQVRPRSWSWRDGIAGRPWSKAPLFRIDASGLDDLIGPHSGRLAIRQE